jgi:outer membrane protein X
MIKIKMIKSKFQSKNVATIVACFTKKVMIVAVALTMSFAANAQLPTQGDMAAGGHLSLYAEDGFSTFGVGAKFRYNVTDPIRLEGALTYFFPNEIMSLMGISTNISMLDFSVNAHYLFPVAERVTLYPLVGLGFLNLRASVSADIIDMRASASESHVIMNFGGGAEFKVADNISIHIEPRLLQIFADNSRGGFTLSAGAMFSF